MVQFVSAEEAVSHIKDGDTVWSNAFLALANPLELQTALGDVFRKTGHPRDLTFCCSAGAGDWKKGSPNEAFLRDGAVKAVILGHYSSMPDTAQMVMDGKLSGYNLPLGVMSKMIRAAAGGEKYFVTDVGLNLFVDPEINGYRLNDLSTDEYVAAVEIEGKRRLRYRVPEMDVALIKGSSSDALGNISFENEATVSDALSLAQAIKARGGTVIVQVGKIINNHQRPWNVIIPAPLVDYIVVCPRQTQIAGIEGYQALYSGDEFYEADPVRDLIIRWDEEKPTHDLVRSTIAQRAVHELKPGYIVNIGIGIPEHVAVEAAKSGLLKDIALTVESGATRGVPASGAAFGAAIGAHSICSMAQQFDFYDSGGLDICFLGCLQIDMQGNVNSHYNAKKLSGIGGFANIAQSTRKVVFCTSFTTGGLKISNHDGNIRIIQEGKIKKFIDRVDAVSFSAKNAIASGQEIWYVTERCVFRLGVSGLELTEVYPGIDIQRDILELLPTNIIPESVYGIIGPEQRVLKN